MKILVFDTETTGFINKKDPSLEAQPHIIQFAWILWELRDWKYNELERKNLFIKPPISIPYWASQVHHIYDIDVQDAPMMHQQIDEIMDFLWKADAIIGHNIEYDEDMLKVELRRLEKLHLYSPSQIICTMKSTVDFCSIEWNGLRFKYPKLWELYKKLFWEYFIWAHDAMVDVEATLKCFLELEKKWILSVNWGKQEIMSLF